MAKRKLKIKVKLDTSRYRLEVTVLDKIVAVLNSKITPKRNIIKSYIKDLIAEMIKSTPEVDAMKDDGQLAKELGFKRGSGQWERWTTAIAEQVKESCNVQFRQIRRKGKKIDGNFILIQIVKSDYSDVLSLGEAEYESINQAGESTPVPWLRWLLTFGDSVINPEYALVNAKTARQRQVSRSKKAIMLRIKGRGLRPFVLNSKYSGLPGDNWLTRAFSDEKRILFLNNVRDFIKSQVL